MRYQGSGLEVPEATTASTREAEKWRGFRVPGFNPRRGVCMPRAYIKSKIIYIICVRGAHTHTYGG